MSENDESGICATSLSKTSPSQNNFIQSNHTFTNNKLQNINANINNQDIENQQSSDFQSNHHSKTNSIDSELALKLNSSSKFQLDSQSPFQFQGSHLSVDNHHHEFSLASENDFTSEASSTFITNPEIVNNSITNQSQPDSNYTFNTNTDSRHSMDASLSSLQRDLANLSPHFQNGNNKLQRKQMNQSNSHKFLINESRSKHISNNDRSNSLNKDLDISIERSPSKVNRLDLSSKSSVASTDIQNVSLPKKVNSFSSDVTGLPIKSVHNLDLSLNMNINSTAGKPSLKDSSLSINFSNAYIDGNSRPPRSNRVSPNSDNLPFTAKKYLENDNLSQEESPQKGLIQESDKMNLFKEYDQPSTNFSTYEESFHSSTIDSLDSTRYNETRAQLDRDIDIDDSSKEKAKIERLKVQTSTPWRRLRAPSNFALNEHNLSSSSDNNNYQQKFIHKDDIVPSSFQQAGGDNASNAIKIDNLNRQITGYKIQIKFFKQFLQNLIDKSRQYEKTDDFLNRERPDGLQEVLDINELTHLQDKFQILSPIKETSSHIQLLNEKNEEFAKLKSDFNNLSSDYDEIFKLNEDLYSNLEDFENQLKDKEFQIELLGKSYENCIGIAHDIIQLLINDYDVDETSKNSLIKCLEDDFAPNSPTKALDMKLHVIRLEINKKLGKSENSRHSNFKPITTDFSYNDMSEIKSHIEVIKDLMHMLDTLRAEFKINKSEVIRIENELKKEIEESNAMKRNYQAMHINFNQLCSLLENEKATNIANPELKKLRNENERLSQFNQTVDAKFKAYEQIIDMLQKEVNDFKETSRRESVLDISKNNKSNDLSLLQSSLGNNIADNFNNNNDNEMQEEVYLLHKEFNSLQNEYNELSENHRKLQNDSSQTISSLTNQLHGKQNENMAFRGDAKVTEKLKQDLDLAIEKQRILKAEKIRLSYKVESLNSDKISLQSTIHSLTDKVTALTIADSQNSINNTDNTNITNDDSILKKLSVLEYHYDGLILFDVFVFQRLLKSFNKIADDSSLLEPKKKIETLANTLNKSHDDNVVTSSPTSSTDINVIIEYHKSVFNYFARAVDIIVNDHVRLLLKESDNNAKHSAYINKLHGRIDHLNKVVDSLSKQSDPYDSNDDISESTTINNTLTSPRSKLRIDELTNRWKAEREARVYENKEAQRRLKELEEENSRLRQDIDSLTM